MAETAARLRQYLTKSSFDVLLPSPPLVQARLSSGLRVCVIPQPHLTRAHASLFARVGSRFESTKNNGLSHFLEHMMYRGTRRFASAHEVNRAFEEIGGYLLAATQVDSGVFSVSCPAPCILETLTLFGEVMSEPSFCDREVEQRIVCEEILEDLDDEGRQIDADNLSRALIYPNHPLGYTITGTEEHVRSFDVEMLRAHHAKHYGSTSSVLCITGNVNPSEVLDVADRAFAKLPKGVRAQSPPPVHRQKGPRHSHVDNVSSQTDLRVCLRAFSETDPRAAALELAMRVIDDGMSTRLYRRICDDGGLCYNVSAAYDGYEDDGVVDFAAGVHHDRVAKVVSEILAVIVDLANDGPSLAELDKAKRRLAWDLEAMRDSAEDTAAYYGDGVLHERLVSVEDRVAAARNTTVEAVREVMHTLAEPSRLNVVTVGQLDDEQRSLLKETVRGFPSRRTPQ